MQDYNIHKGETLYDKAGKSVIQCESCGYMHIFPLPSDGELKALYQEEFYAEGKPAYLTNAEEDMEWIKQVAADKYDTFESLISKKDRSIVDIGCGPGFFLDEGKERGWNVLGIEPSIQASEFVRGRGIEVVTSMFDVTLAEKYSQTFDAVHMSNVLEHVKSPHDILANIKKMLIPGGIICITVPNDFNPFQLVLTENCDYDAWWVAPHHHLNYFNFKSLEKLLSTHGFEYVDHDASFPLELFLLMGDNYVADSKLGRDLHHKRVAFDLTMAKSQRPSVRKALYSAFADIGLGRLATVYGKLPE